MECATSHQPSDRGSNPRLVVIIENDLTRSSSPVLGGTKSIFIELPDKPPIRGCQRAARRMGQMRAILARNLTRRVHFDDVLHHELRRSQARSRCVPQGHRSLTRMIVHQSIHAVYMHGYDRIIFLKMIKSSHRR